MALFTSKRSHRLGNGKPLTQGRGASPSEFKEAKLKRNGFTINYKTGLRVYV